MASNASQPYALLVLLSLVLCSANAHESHDNRIEHLDAQLDQVPSGINSDSVMILLRRADLHRRQNHWDAALHDYRQVAETDPQNITMLVGRAQLHLDQHHYEESILWSSRVLRLQPDHAMAELVSARALSGIGNYDAASDAFDRAIKRFAKPRPEHYIEHAYAVLADKQKQNAESKAIAILDSGAQALGHPISLHSLSVELERNSGQLDAALSRTNHVLRRNGSLLSWRLQRGELLLELNRHAAALSEVQCVIQVIQELPSQRRYSHAFQSMMRRSQHLVAQIKEMSATNAKAGIVPSVKEC